MRSISLRLCSALALVTAAAMSAGAQQHSMTLLVQESARLENEHAAGRSALNRVISIDLRDVPITEALREIGKLADLPLVYSSGLLPEGKRVTLRAERITAGAALNRVLTATDVTVRVLSGGQIVLAPHSADISAVADGRNPDGLYVSAITPVMAAANPPLVQGTVQGTVVDATTGAPLSGASVSVTGTSLGSLSGADGRYTITGVPDGPVTLRAAMIGYASVDQTTTVVPNQSATVDFRLTQQAITLQGIVAVGYGTQERSDVTGSVASVSPQRMERMPNTSVEQALQAAVPGVSIQTTGAGAEQNNSIQIRGRNSIRASNEPLVVVDGIPYNGPISELNQNDVASIDVLKDASSAAIYGARGSNGVILITTKKGVVGEPRFAYSGYVGVQEATNIPRLMNGVEQAQWRCELLLQGQSCDERLFTNTELEALANGRSTDWVGLALRRGFQQQHDLSFSGGSEGTRYYIAGSLLDVEGLAKNDQFQRATLRVNLNQDVTSWLSMGTSTQLANVDRSGLPANFGAAFRLSPLTIPFDEDGNQMIYPWPEDPFFGNPLEPLLVADDNVSRRVLSSNFVEVEFPFIEGLSYRLNGGVDFAAGDLGRYYGRDTQTGVGVRGVAVVENSTRREVTVENIVNYSRDFGVHDLGFTALYSTQSSVDERESLRAQGFPNDVLSYYQANVATLVEPTTSFSDWRLVSQMGRLNYGYDGRYLLTITARRDGYSGFGSNHKYGLFPSLAVAWNLSNESFWPADLVLSSLKLRGSYGKNGNQAISPYQTLARLSEYSYVDGGGTAPGYIPATLANPNLRWETTTSANLGVDFGLLGDRVRGTLDAYVAETNDLLLDRLVSPVHGITEITENIGAVSNRGIELSLSSLNLERDDFTWSTDFNISANRNEIAALYGGDEDDVANNWFIGEPIGINYGYITDGIWQLNDDIAGSAQPEARPGDVRIRDRNGDGRISPEDRGFHGSRDPSYIAGLNNSVGYRALTLDVFFQIVQGVTQSNSLLAAGGNTAYEGRGNTLLLDYWTPDNPSNTTPANRFDSNPHAAAFYQDASFVRLKDLTLSLAVPSRLTSRMGAENVRVYVNGRNLWTATDWTGLGPDLSNQFAVPLERLLTAGASVSF